MEISFYKWIETEIKEKFKSNNIVIWYDYNKEFKTEFDLFKEADINKIAYNGSFIELRYNILNKDKDLEKKWLIYSDKVNTNGFLTEFEYFGEAYTVSIKDILEKKYKVDFTGFDVLNLDDRLRVFKRVWDVIPENILSDLDQETLDELVLTNGFGYVDINKEYTVLKYICETEKYEAVLEEAKIKDKFLEFVKNEYGIDVTKISNTEDRVMHIVENLFQSELIQKSKNKEIKPFNVELSNKNKIINCVQLLETWANHEEYRNYFVKYSKDVSNKYIKNIINNIEIEELLSIEYIEGIEEVLYKKLQLEVLSKSHDQYKVKEDLISYVNGATLNDEQEQYYTNGIDISISNLKSKLNDLKSFVSIRKRYYFSKTKIFRKWTILSEILKILELLYNFEDDIRSGIGEIDNIIRLYEKNSWWKIDNLYRKIQESYIDVDDFILNLVKIVDRQYIYEYLKPLNEEVANYLENKNIIDSSIDLQIDFWKKHISNSDKQTAIIVVDALRFEMGKELFNKLDDLECKKITPLISSLPSVTEFGMSSILPNDSTNLRVIHKNDKVEIYDGNFNEPLNNKKERVKYFLNQAYELGLVKELNQVVDMPAENISNEFRNKSRIIIYSSDIDEAGHIEDSSIQMFPGILSKIESCIKKIYAAGIERIVVVADHGFILTSGMEDWMKINLSKDVDNITKKRRYSISKNKVQGNYITKTSHELNYDGNLNFNFPRGISIFSAKGGTKFYHGGISVQEMLVPVIVIEKQNKNIFEDIKIDSSLQINFATMPVSKEDNGSKDTMDSKNLKDRIEKYIKSETINKREKAVLELFTKAYSYTDSEIQELCMIQGIKFVSKSVMSYMDELIENLDKKGYDWIGFRVVGMSTYEYFLK